MHITCYCKWGFPDRKPTSIWTNAPDLALPMCDSRTPCAIERKLGRHLVTAQAGSSGEMSGIGSGENMYGMSPRLARYLFKRGIESLEQDTSQLLTHEIGRDHKVRLTALMKVIVVLVFTDVK